MLPQLLQLAQSNAESDSKLGTSIFEHALEKSRRVYFGKWVGQFHFRFQILFGEWQNPPSPRTPRRSKPPAAPLYRFSFDNRPTPDWPRQKYSSKLSMLFRRYRHYPRRLILCPVLIFPPRPQ